MWDFYHLAQTRFTNKDFSSVVNTVLGKPSIPLHLSLSTLDALPESPGVYIFYGESKIPLYIGKSISIRDRVLSHFANDHLSIKDMKISKQIKEIKTIQTSGELGALLLESELIKKIPTSIQPQTKAQTQVSVASESEENINQQCSAFVYLGLIIILVRQS